MSSFFFLVFFWRIDSPPSETGKKEAASRSKTNEQTRGAGASRKVKRYRIPSGRNEIEKADEKGHVA